MLCASRLSHFRQATNVPMCQGIMRRAPILRSGHRFSNKNGSVLVGNLVRCLATRGLRDAIAEHNAAAERANAAASAAADVERRAGELDQRAADLANERTRVDVAAGAIGDRAAALTTREQAFEKREADLVAKEQALTDRIEKYRSALSA